MEFKARTLRELGDMICGNLRDEQHLFVYRSSKFITEFFEDCDTSYIHRGETRVDWVADVLKQILQEPQSHADFPPDTFLRVIQRLMEQEDATNEGRDRSGALALLNNSLRREGFEAFYATDNKCYLRHIVTNATTAVLQNPHRPFSSAEYEKRKTLAAYLERISEDCLIEEILLPLFRQRGFHRITASGHKDKALEYGKDVWMKYMLPTQHVLYFGIQAKKGKLDAAGASKASTANIAEIYHQVLMMLDHEVFDPEIGKRVLPDHAFIVAGGEITKSARNWLGNKLDASKRSQVLFMDREDILNLYVTANLPLPAGALPQVEVANNDEMPF